MEALLQLMQTVSTKFGIFSGLLTNLKEHPGSLILGARLLWKSSFTTYGNKLTRFLFKQQTGGRLQRPTGFTAESLLPFMPEADGRANVK